jgi:hypothetical protein
MAYNGGALSDDGNFDYLNVSQEDTQVLGNIKEMAEHLKKLAYNVMEAEALLKQAKAEYDSYRYQTLPAAMQSAGLQSLQTQDGSSIEIKNKFYCNPNKNDADRLKIGKWLAENGAQHLIKRQAIVDGKQIEALRDKGVPFVEKWDMNTNSLKAWIKDGLGMNGGVAKFSMGDIPECIHFTQIDEAEITV